MDLIFPKAHTYKLCLDLVFFLLFVSVAYSDLFYGRSISLCQHSVFEHQGIYGKCLPMTCVVSLLNTHNPRLPPGCGVSTLKILRTQVDTAQSILLLHLLWAGVGPGNLLCSLSTWISLGFTIYCPWCSFICKEGKRHWCPCYQVTLAAHIKTDHWK